MSMVLPRQTLLQQLNKPGVVLLLISLITKLWLRAMTIRHESL